MMQSSGSEPTVATIINNIASSGIMRVVKWRPGLRYIIMAVHLDVVIVKRGCFEVGRQSAQERQASTRPVIDGEQYSGVFSVVRPCQWQEPVGQSFSVKFSQSKFIVEPCVRNSVIRPVTMTLRGVISLGVYILRLFAPSLLGQARHF